MIHPQDPEPTRAQLLREFALPILALALGLIMAARTWLS